MGRITSICILLLLGVDVLCAQQRVKGSVVDTAGRALEFVNVVAMKLPDSSFVAGRVTDARGQFYFEGLPQECSLVFSCVGYSSQTHQARPEMKIVLSEEPSTLSELTVVARRVKEHAGGYSIKMQNNPLMKGKSLVQGLDLLPNIHAEQGKISILGKVVEAIYVDGLRLSSPSELENLPMEQVDNVQVDYVSSTEEGATATGGVLRITMKKGASGGYTSQLQSEHKYMPHYGWRGSSLSNYTTATWRKLTLRNSLTLGKILGLSDELYTMLNKQTGQIQQNDVQLRRWEQYVSNRATLSLEVAKRHLWSTSLLFSYEGAKPKTQTIDLATEAVSHRHESHHTRLWQWLNKYSWEINDRLNFDFSTDYLWRGQSQSSEVLGQVLGRQSVTQYTDMWRFKPLLKYKAGSSSILSVGADLQLIGQTELASGFAETKMESFMPSLFTSYSGMLGRRLRYELGLRVQQTKMKTERLEQHHEYSHTGIFPSLSAMYQLNPKKRHLINLQLSRVMETIPYSAISDYREYQSAHSYSVGNPAIKAPIGFQAMTMLSLWGRLNVMFGVMHCKNPIYSARGIDEVDTSVTFIQTQNGDYQLLKYTSIEGRLKLASWWETKTTAIFRLHSADAGVVVKNQRMYMLRHASTFTFTSSFGAGLNLMYEPTYYYLERKMYAVGSVSGYIYKTMLKDKLNLRLDFDIYRKQRMSLTENEQVAFRMEGLTHSPHLSLSLSYSFGGGKKLQALPTAQELQSYQRMEDIR